MVSRPFLCIVLGLCFLLTGCDVSRVDPVVKIGVVAPFDGELQHVGYDLLYSVRLAVREVNAAGGIGGNRVALVIYSDSTDTRRAVEVADALVIDDSVVAVLGHWHPETTAAAAPVYTAANLAFLPMGEGHLGATDPAVLPEEFRAAYNAIAFEAGRQPTEWAGTAYDGMQLVFQAIDVAQRTQSSVSRTAIAETIEVVSVKGLTGDVALSP